MKTETTLQKAKKWIDESDAVLICAGAGMSVKEGECVYVNEDDFQKYYPYFLKWGYKHSYQGMGLMFDYSVPETAKWGYWSDHITNQRWRFEPNDGYATLLNMVKDKDYFVFTSNADGCFERSGFEVNRIYTPQGDWQYYQCLRPCQPDAVFESKSMLYDLLAEKDDNGLIPKRMIPRCPLCGGEVFGNVRFGREYLHARYEEQNDVIRDWMEKLVSSTTETVAIIEIGAGFNTPIVTRYPMESFARDLGNRGRFIRINPDHSEVPDDVLGLSLAAGWEVLDEIKNAKIDTTIFEEGELQKSVSPKNKKRFTQPNAWNEMIANLKDRR